MEVDKFISWLESIADQHDVSIISLNYIMCSDDHLLEINREHLNHDYYTDIITFPYQEGEVIASDLFISVDRIKDNAATLGLTMEEEFRRVVVHGFLHLIGYDDKTPALKQEMRAAEDKYLKEF